MNKKHADIQAVLDRHGLTIMSEFVPFSQSRNKNEKNPSLNWKVTLLQNGRKILTTDYMAGCGHAPSYKQSFKRAYENEQIVKKECETGLQCRMMYSMDFIQPMKNKPILPNIHDVIYSLLMDSEVLDYPDFESWALEFGYDTDSRQAEKTYNACLKIALPLRAIGESTIAELRDVYQDY